jgi:tetraacyldisaccharide 4'-kinase
VSELLRPAEGLYRGLNRIRRALYRKGMLPARALPRPVVSVGNRSVGGSGKTPTTITLAKLLTARGYAVAILTRGYGRSGSGVMLVDRDDPTLFGDEPVLLAQSLPDVPVVVGSDRFESGQWFLQRGDCDLFLLDDGFQHLQLSRDVDIVIESPAPRWYREGSSALADADIVLSRGADVATVDTPLFPIRMVPTVLYRAEVAEPVERLRGARLFAFSALADNRQFFDMLRLCGAEIAGTREFSDHHRYEPAEIEQLRRDATNREALLITTAKDAVKLGGEVAWVEVAMEIDRADELVRLIETRCNLPREKRRG